MFILSSIHVSYVVITVRAVKSSADDVPDICYIYICFNSVVGETSAFGEMSIVLSWFKRDLFDRGSTQKKFATL